MYLYSVEFLFGDIYKRGSTAPLPYHLHFLPQAAQTIAQVPVTSDLSAMLYFCTGPKAAESYCRLSRRHVRQKCTELIRTLQIWGLRHQRQTSFWSDVDDEELRSLVESDPRLT